MEQTTSLRVLLSSLNEAYLGCEFVSDEEAIFDLDCAYHIFRNHGHLLLHRGWLMERLHIRMPYLSLLLSVYLFRMLHKTSIIFQLIIFPTVVSYSHADGKENGLEYACEKQEMTYHFSFKASNLYNITAVFTL
jgi:hypothetical protein